MVSPTRSCQDVPAHRFEARYSYCGDYPSRALWAAPDQRGRWGRAHGLYLQSRYRSRRQRLHAITIRVVDLDGAVGGALSPDVRVGLLARWLSTEFGRRGRRSGGPAIG